MAKERLIPLYRAAFDIGLTLPTLESWRLHGIDGVKLETWLDKDGVRCTTREALVRFRPVHMGTLRDANTS